MSCTHLLVVRHGETTWNVEGRYQGHCDSPLTLKGLAQSRALAERLARLHFAALYSSDLGRARATAELIVAQTGHALQLEPRLRERHLGLFEGLSKQDAQRLYSEEFAAWKQGGPDALVPRGETARQGHERVVTCLEERADQHSGGTIVIVGHGGTLSSLLRHALSIPLEAPRRFHLSNGSFNHFVREDGRWFLQTWGDTSHLSSWEV